MRAHGFSDHRTYQHYFAGIDGEAVLALRHLLSCPVCARVSRLLLFGFLAPRDSRPPGGPSAQTGEGTPQADLRGDRMSHAEELKHLLDTIRLALRLLDVTNREIESRKGWSHGYLSRILAGSIELRMEHVLDITRILGMEPAEFFDLAWPHKPQPPTPSAARLQSLLRRYQPTPPPAAVSRDEVVQMLREALEELGREAPPPALESNAERDA